MAGERETLLEVLAAAPDGLTRPELLAGLREKVPYLQPADVERQLVAAGDAVSIEGDRIYGRARKLESVPEPAVLRPRRFVVFDLESVVRPIVKEPYREQHVFQIGGVRFGPDAAWVAEQAEFVAFTALRDAEDELLIYRDDLRERYEVEKRPLADVLEEFRSFCAGADAVTAYNGVAHDFRLLEEEYARCELPPLLSGTGAPRLVDALYLAQALWPIPPRQHRLKELLERLEIDVEEMHWHDALDDSKMVVELLEHGTTVLLLELGEEMLGLLIAAGIGSDAWELLLALAGREPNGGPLDGNETARILLETLQEKASKEPLRPEPPAAGEEDVTPGRVAITIPEKLQGARGQIDIDKLVASVKGEGAEARDAQRAMVAQIRNWLETGAPALVEAPTGTGKSYAILAAALDWLAADPENKVVISTFTKQLQSQLAADIEALTEQGLPQLAQTADMVKGAVNRLSLRALVLALAELTEPDERKHRRGRQNFSRDPRYRDLVLYLALRFVAEGKPTEEWEARSVDPVDVPPFFDEYCPRRLSLYLASLSQAENEDYRPDRGGIGLYTTSVGEALESRRLVVANHALLLAHLDDFERLGERTLLFVDEAHELENTATNALSSKLDSGALTELAAQGAEWAEENSDVQGADRVANAALNLDRYLDDERLARAAMRAFDTAERDPLGRNVLRAVTVASPLQGDAFVQPMEHLAAELRTTHRIVGLVVEALRRIAAENPPTDSYELDRMYALYARATGLDRALSTIVRDIDAVLAPAQAPAPQTGEEQAAVEEQAEREAEQEEQAQQLQLVEVDGDGEEAEQLMALDGVEENELLIEDTGAELAPDGSTLVAARPNRVVFAEELDEFRAGRARFYRFRLVSSPIELGREDEWRTFKRRFGRAYYVSATLRVADGWDFIRRRLDFPAEEVEAIALSSPFDAGRQAQLVCFADFPSWAEHAEAAMHTVAHQLAGYASELVDEEGHNGAMALTTSRAAAAGIFDSLARLRVVRGESYPLISAGIEGNQRAVQTFSKVGGLLVGTRGLWQGVDIAEAERLRLVWINKLPFAPFADPVIGARLQLEVERAEFAGEDDPEQWANEHYYLPLAALSLRQAVGRLIRSREHRGVVVISDRKLAGPTRLRRLYRQVFLGSLDPGLMRTDEETEEAWLGNVVTMQEGWKRIFAFLARERILDTGRAEQLSSLEELERFTELPETLAILREELTREQEQVHRDAGTLPEELVTRATRIARQLNPSRGLIELKPKQREAIAAIARGDDLLGVLPTGYGKSYVFQLPALALPGVTIVVSPLVSLMTDQALELNRTIGGRVRALVAPMRESNSRTGKSEVEQELRGQRSYGIKLVYLSPERLCQRHFQEWIRAGVEAGIIRRIALDEAHTFVQWGDDFRPSVRRAEDFLRRLKAEHPEVQLLALTATANDTVREGLRSNLFGLRPGERRAGFSFVQANPLRPELAIYKRVLPQHQGGPTSVAGLVERVVEAIEGHAIFYCLTVRHVEAVYAHLSDFLQGQPVDVLMYHGRLTDAEKTGVANAFRSAPPKGEEGYQRMIVVATSAFGLGVDRPDIRCVFCVSPPTDLAALYQQLGRAGRDRAVRPDEGEYTAGLTISYPRAQRTISFMTQQRVADDLLARICGRLLQVEEVFSARGLAQDLIDEDLAAGKLSGDEAMKEETLDTYQTGVLRVLAELSLRALVDDLGDFPRTLEVRRGDYEADTEGYRELIEAVVAALRSGDHKVETLDLYEALKGDFPEECRDPGALWATLLELHTLGYLDVSQRPNREQLTAVAFHSRALPQELVRGLSRRQAQIRSEVEQLRGWFSTSGVCCNEGLRRYFAADALPSGTCQRDENRCSAHWNQAGLPTDAVEPKLYEAFTSAALRPASATTRGRRRAEEQLDKLVWHLLWHNYTGLVESIIFSVLRGEDHFYSRQQGKRIPLWPKLLLSRVRGRKPALRRDDLRASLQRLIDKNEVTRTGVYRYRLSRYVEQDAARAAADYALPAVAEDAAQR